ncbi:MAG: MraY family glycosyltransferase [Patescibacteria group bacterium]
MIDDLAIYLVAILASFLLSFFLVPLIIKLALKFKVIDKPTADRKIHRQPIPLLGGLAIFIASFAVLFVFRFFHLANFAKIPDQFIFGVLAAGTLLMIGGWLDDKYQLKPWQQVIWPVAAALLVLFLGIKINYITNPLGGPANAIIYLAPAIGMIISFFWLMGMMYTTKFLDGLDGLASGIAAIASVIIFLLSLDWDVPMSATGIWSLIILGATAGFLVFNWHPAKIFMGEGGSVFLGFILAVLSIISGSKIATTLLVLGLPALDVLAVVIWRLLRKESPFSHADKKHLHFRLLDLGLSQTSAVLLLILISLVFGSLAIVFHGLGKLVGLAVMVLLMLALIVFFALKNQNNSSRTDE